MLPSFVIGLREGLEAALIVGIIAAFLRKQGRRDLLRWVMVGVGVAVLLCLGAGIALRLFSQNLPQKQQEGLETVIAVLAIGMVTYMVVWMRRNSRNLKGQLEGLASEALADTRNAGRAMVLMAFLAVIREGLETVVFLLAAFNESANGATAGIGATLGIVLAVALGYGIYRGGVKLNLSKFFRATGAVLVLVAAGLVVNAFHTAHEAGWVDFGQQRTVDLTWLVEPGTVQASLLTGMLGLQPRPVLVEVVAWLVYLVPVGLYVVWPPGRPAPATTLVRGGFAVAGLAGVAALVLVLVAPGRPGTPPPTGSANGGGGSTTVQVVSRSPSTAVVRTESQQVIERDSGPLHNVRLRAAGAERHAGLDTERYQATERVASDIARPDELPVEQVARLNGGALPIGIRATAGVIPVRYVDRLEITVWVDARTDRVIDARWREAVTVVAGSSTNNTTLDKPVDEGTLAISPGDVGPAVAAARADHDALTHRSQFHTAAGWCLAVAIVALVVALAFLLVGRRRRAESEPVPVPAPDLDLVKH